MLPAVGAVPVVVALATLLEAELIDPPVAITQNQ